MRILGVDPGLRVTGYGVIDAVSERVSQDGGMELVEAGVIRTHARGAIADTLERIYTGLEEIIAEFRPEVLVIEKLYSHYKHPSTAIMMGHARGVVCLLSGLKNLPLVSIPSTHVKKTVSGCGHAGKDQVGRMVQRYLGLKPTVAPPDATDALAIAITYVFNSERSRGTVNA